MMNLAGFTNILAKTAAHIEKTVQSSIHEVTGPKALSEYDIGEQVGSGGPGMLWKLYRGKPKSKAQQTLSAEVCVWFLDKKALAEERSRRGTSKAAEEALLDIFRADAARLLRLRHPGVVRVVDALDESKAAMAMVTEPIFSSVANAIGNFENMPKIPTELEQLALGELEIKHGLLQLTETLGFLHNNAKLVHRAISPETVFITAGGGWKFGGFGFAAFCDQSGLVNAVDGDVAFHYPEFDVDSPTLPLQPLLDYTAPELTRNSSPSDATREVRVSADVFSLGLLTYQLIAKKLLLRCNNNLHTYMAKVSFLPREPWGEIPSDLLPELQRMLSQEPASRPSALEFGGSMYFRDDMRLRALRFLDHMLERDNLQKAEFLKALKGLWTGFEPRILRYKVLPPLLAELRNDAMQQLTLPMVLLIADAQEAADFQVTTQPSMLPLLQTASGETLLLLVKHIPMLLSKVSAPAMSSHLLPLLVRAFEDADPRIQEEVLRRTQSIAMTLEYSVLKQSVLPRVHALALRTSVAVVRVHALVSLGEMVPRLEKAGIMDVLQTLARCAAVDHSPSTLLCVLGVADKIHKQYGVEFAAEHLLPLLCPLLIVQQLSAPQFAKYLNLVYSILKKIEEKRGVSLAEADSVSLDLQALSQGLKETAAPSGASKPISAAPATRTSWEDSDSWGPVSATKKSSSSPDLVTSSSLAFASTGPLYAAPTSVSPPPSLPVPGPMRSSSSASNVLEFEWPPPAPLAAASSSSSPPSSAFPAASSGGRSQQPSHQATLFSAATPSAPHPYGGSSLDDFLGPPLPSMPQAAPAVNTAKAVGAPMASYSTPALKPVSPYSPMAGGELPQLDSDDPFKDWPPATSASGSFLAGPLGTASGSTNGAPPAQVKFDDGDWGQLSSTASATIASEIPDNFFTSSTAAPSSDQSKAGGGIASVTGRPKARPIRSLVGAAPPGMGSLKLAPPPPAGNLGLFPPPHPSAPGSNQGSGTGQQGQFLDLL